jgi:hypothetical protein
VPVEEETTADGGSPAGEPEPFAERLDAARARLRDAIPPVEEE